MSEETPKFKMTTEQQQKAIAWLRSKDIKGCPVCSKGTLSINVHFIELRTFSFGEMFSPGYVYPHFMVTCKNCAHQMLFDAVQSGLLKDPEESRDPDKQEVTSGN